jgi:LPS O-antigen subunit length determinant protein (WzzB/FepE family)
MLQRADRLPADSLAAITENLYIAGLYDTHRAATAEQVTTDRNIYSHIKAALNADIQTIQVLEHATKPLVKSRPVRSVMIIGAGFVALLLGVLGILLFEQYRTIDWKQITEA